MNMVSIVFTNNLWLGYVRPKKIMERMSSFSFIFRWYLTALVIIGFKPFP